MYKEGRNQAGLTLEEAAFRIPVSPRMLRKYESGEVTPSPETVVRMAKVYNAPELIARYCRECPIGQVYGYEVLDGVSLDLASVVLSLRQETAEAVDKLATMERLARNRRTRADFTAEEWEAFVMAVQEWLDVEHNLAALRLVLGHLCDVSELVEQHNQKCRSRGYVLGRRAERGEAA